MNKLVFAGVLVLGIVLIVLGINASNSFSSGVSRFFTGSPTNKTIWLLGCGIVATLVGAAGLLRGFTSSK